MCLARLDCLLENFKPSIHSGLHGLSLAELTPLMLVPLSSEVTEVCVTVYTFVRY